VAEKHELNNDSGILLTRTEPFVKIGEKNLCAIFTIKPSKHLKGALIMNRLILLLVASFSALTIAVPLIAQVTTVTLEGTITDNEGKPLPLANVIVKNEETAVVRGASSDQNGRYRVLGIPPGTYSVQVQYVGYRTARKDNVEFVTGQRPILNFVLAPEALQLSEVVVVGARAEEFELRRLDVSTAVVRDQILNLPLNSRSALNLAAVAPGIRSFAPTAGRSLPSAGSLPDLRFINFYVDGAEWKSQFNGNIVGIPQTGSPMPQESIQEFRVILSPFDAEFTRGGAWIINALTRRGTNRYQVEAFSFFRDKSLNARGPFETVKPDFNRQQVGATVSGPLIPDKLFFLTSYELHRTNDFIDVIPGRPAYNPGLWDRYRGTFDAPNRNHTGVLRLTYQHTDDQTFDYIWSTRRLTSKTFFGGIFAEQAGIFGEYDINSHMLKHTWMVSATSFNELSLHYLRWRHFEPTINKGPAYQYPSIVLGRGTFPIRVAEDRYRLINKYTTRIDDFYGPHILKMGFEIGRVSMTPWFPSFIQPLFEFATDTSSLPFRATIGVGLLNPLDPNGIDAETDDVGTFVSLFVQDQWNVSPRLTLNLGVRYDAEINTLNNSQRVPWADSTDLVNLLPPTWLNKGDRKNDLNNISPRISFNYDVFGTGRTILRGGFGIMFDRTAYFFAYNERRDALWRTYVFSNPGTLDPAVLRARVAAGGVGATPSMNLLDQNIQTPRTNQLSFGIGHQFTEEFGLNLDYINQRSYNIYASLNVNYRKPSLGRRVLTNKYGDIIVWQSLGESFTQALLTNLSYRTPTMRLLASYTLSFSESSYDGSPDQRRTDRADYRMQRSEADERHRLVLTGVFQLPYGFQVSGIATIATPRPFSVTDGRDLNDNGNLADDWPGGVRTEVPALTFRNCYKMVDFRLSKSFTFEPVRVELMFEAFNLFNWFNASGYSGRRYDAAGNPLASFGQPTGAFAPRQMQLGFRVSY
jgi:hypothetical protein